MALQDRSVLGSLVGDLVLLVLFTTQHSLLAWSPVKRTLQSLLGVLSRTAYCFTTALALQVEQPTFRILLPFLNMFVFSMFYFCLPLQVLIHNWQPVTGAPCLWSVRHAPWSIWFPLLCFLLHFICWAIICSIIIIFDYPELMGIKQVRILCIIYEITSKKVILCITLKRGINKHILKSYYKLAYLAI